jgi:predicted membrane-bound dolichyl-phosphate-mannose-protein mannosyltransferase
MSWILIFIISPPKVHVTYLQEKSIIKTALDWFINDEKAAEKVNTLKIMTYFLKHFRG